MEGILNYYNVLFNNETAIIICSADKGKEGMIEKVSENLSDIFIYKEEELKGMNIGLLMPRMFEKDHRRFMQRNINIGEKRIIDKTFRTYAKDKNTFVKDISRIGRDIKNIIIVDNNENNFMLNKENGIKICSYYGDDEENNGNKKNDNALLELKKISFLFCQKIP